MKSLYERFKDNELPQPLLEKLKIRAELAKDKDEYWFIIGFFMAKNLDDYKDKDGNLNLDKE